MNIPIQPVRIVMAISFAAQVYLACFRGAFWRLRDRLPPMSLRAKGTSITVVIPARDEAALIGRTVGSLSTQQFDGNLRVIVADDESADSTAEASREAGADFVVHVADRPPEWKGKLWAVASAIDADQSAPDFYLLTDADIEYASPAIVTSLVAQAESGFDLVSVMVRLRTESIAEKFLVPAFVFFFFKLYPPAWVNSGRTAAAAGGCMLIRRETIERIGGIESIRSALIDDCALAKRVHAAGGRVWLGISALEIRSIRQYGEVRDVRAMISRSAFAQLHHSTLLLLATILGMSVIYIAPVASLFTGDPISIALGAASWALSAAIFLPTVREYHAPWGTAFSLPGIALFYILATVESAVRYWSGRGGEWKGRLQDARFPNV